MGAADVNEGIWTSPRSVKDLRSRNKWRGSDSCEFMGDGSALSDEDHCLMRVRRKAFVLHGKTCKSCVSFWGPGCRVQKCKRIGVPEVQFKPRPVTAEPNWGVLSTRGRTKSTARNASGGCV